MGDALIKQVSPKGGNNTLVAVFWGERGSATLGHPTNKVRYSCDPDFFSYAAYVFTALKSFNATVRVIGRGSYNTAGTQITSDYTLYRNGVSIASGSMTNSNSTVGATVNVNLAKDDTLEVETKCSSSSTAGISVGFYVEVA